MDGTEREHALIDPVQMNQVCLLKLPQFRDVIAYIGNINLEEMFLREMQTAEDHQPLPKERPLAHW